MFNPVYTDADPLLCIYIHRYIHVQINDTALHRVCILLFSLTVS